MSRFPNGAPIATSDRHVVAVFNKAVTPQDLIDKCDAVWYYNGQAYALHSYPNAQGTHSDRIILASTDDENDPYQISLDISSNTLTWVQNDNGYLFDFDYNHQNRKLFDANTGTYLLEMPVLSDSASYLPVVKVNNDQGVEEDEINITLYIASSSYDPLCANKEDIEDIDVSEWFNGSYPDSAAGRDLRDRLIALLSYICEIEYEWGDRNIAWDRPEDVTIDGGTLNLFTDGGQPINMVSRLSSGSPVMASSLTNNGVVLCTFNRQVDVSELAGKTSIVIRKGAGVETVTSSDGGNYVDFHGEIGTMKCKIEGRRLIATNIGDTADIYDIDYNSQHRRQFPVPTISSCKYITMPGIAENILVKFTPSAVTEGNIDAAINIDDNNNMKYWDAAQREVATINVGASASLLYQNLFAAVMRMEFDNTSYLTRDGFNDNPTGPIDLLTYDS